MIEFKANKILVIDDNESIHEDFKKALSLKNSVLPDEILALKNSLFDEKPPEIHQPEFTVDTALQGEQGFALVKEAIAKQSPYALAFIDVRMPPGWDGIKAIEEIWKIDPQIQTVICTAYSDYTLEDILERLGHSDRLLLLKKPFDLIEVHLMALSLTKKWQLNQLANLKMQTLQELVDKQTALLASSLSLTQATLESTADGIFAIDINNKISIYNQQFLKMWQIPDQILQNKPATDLANEMAAKMQNTDEISVNLSQLVEKNVFSQSREILLKNGEIIEEVIKPQYMNDQIQGAVYSFRNITQRKRLEEELAKQATYDNLTGLPNRTLLIDRIQQTLSRAKRETLYFAVLFIDLDSFKAVNDVFGHDVGNELLKAFAQRLRTQMRRSDTIARLENENDSDIAARFGGDEFVAIITLPSTDKELLTKIIKRYYDALSAPYHVVNHEIFLTLSIGVSVYPENGKDANALIKNADVAMYHAKAIGKGSFQFYQQEMSETLQNKLMLENDLRHALARNELFLQYQPLIDVKTGKVSSMEALMRWQHPKLGLISPLTFIPIAEATGLIIPIGNWMIKAACAQNKAWQNSGLSPVRISINLSGYQFEQKNIVDIIKQALAETDLAPEFLEIEITENTLLHDVNSVIDKILELKRLGVIVDIDDFGTGYSSLSYIKQFPIDKIKIDQSFIRELENNKTRAIVEAIMLLAKNLNLGVVAEGVETSGQLGILQKLATDQVQGFYLGKPTSGQEAAEFLKNTNK